MFHYEAFPRYFPANHCIEALAYLSIHPVILSMLDTIVNQKSPISGANIRHTSQFPRRLVLRFLISVKYHLRRSCLVTEHETLHPAKQQHIKL